MLNEEKFVERAIRSVANADEVIVVDGGSKDQSVSIARQTGATVIESAPGRGAQLRTGAEEATGNVFLLLHADTWLDNSAIELLRTRSRTTRPFHGCFRQRIDDSRIRYRVLERGNSIRATWLGMPYGDQAPVSYTHLTLPTILLV